MLTGAVRSSPFVDMFSMILGRGIFYGVVVLCENVWSMVILVAEEQRGSREACSCTMSQAGRSAEKRAKLQTLKIPRPILRAGLPKMT